MMQDMIPSSSRLDDLLADRATVGLGEAEENELRDLLREHPATGSDGYDRAAAALALSLSLRAGLDQPPSSLQPRIERTAVQWLAESKGLRIANVAADADDRAARPSARPRSAARLFPWLIAAACAVAAVIAWTAGDSRPDPAELYRTIAAQPGSATHRFTDSGGVPAGEIVWNGRTQQGVMRFDRLEANDPGDVQYQLWIFDRGRAAHSEFTAVDGGVFDIPASDREVFVPVDAKLHISDPDLFAVTTEPPGGVVKHIETQRHRIVLTAPPS